MWGILVALISGALMSIQGVFNTEVTKQTSLWVSTGWVQLSAFAVCVLAWIFTGRDSIAALWQVENKYTLLGGVIGAFITITVIQSMGSLGPARAAMLIVISQLAVAYVIELFGLFGVEKVDFEWRRLLGMAIAIVGISLVISGSVILLPQTAAGLALIGSGLIIMVLGVVATVGFGKLCEVVLRGLAKGMKYLWGKISHRKVVA